MKFVFLSLFLLLISACNLNQNVWIRGVDLHTHQSNGITFVDLETIVTLGNLKLPNTTFPIVNDSHEIGETSIQHLDDGTSRVSVTINYNEALKIDHQQGKTLPNGREIPVSLENDTHLVGIPILQNSKVYIGGKINGILHAGVALNVPAFDHILSKSTNASNFFISYPFSNEFLGLGGIYSGSQNGQNGLAIFVQKSNIENLNNQNNANWTKQGKWINQGELKKLNQISRIRLNYLFNKHAILRIK